MKKLTITGNLGKDPELRVDQNGNSFAVFSVAVAVGTKASPKTDWIDVSCNGKLVDVVMTYAKKGSKVLVDGFPCVNAYINNDNIPIGIQRLYAHSFEFLGHKIEKESSSGTNLHVHDEIIAENFINEAPL
jgi:single-strand DNA-binding protein